MSGQVGTQEKSKVFSFKLVTAIVTLIAATVPFWPLGTAAVNTQPPSPSLVQEVQYWESQESKSSSTSSDSTAPSESLKAEVEYWESFNHQEESYVKN
jgi:hypothetical protein